MRQRKTGTVGEQGERCRRVQKRVLGGEGLTRVGRDGFGSSLDAELGFRELAFLILALCVGKIK